MNRILFRMEEAALASLVLFSSVPPEKVFPTILIVLDIAAAVVAFNSGDFRRSIYWTAAAILTASVTY